MCVNAKMTDFTVEYKLTTTNNDTIILSDGCIGILPDILLKVGVTNAPSSTSNLRARDWETGAINGSDVFAEAVNSEKYIELKIKASGNNVFTIDSIQFIIRRSTTGPRQWQWRGNADEFATPLSDYKITQAHILNADNGTITTEDVEITTISKVNSLRLGNEYENIADSVVFRFYGFNAEGTAGTGGFHSVKVYGSYSKSIPTEFEKTLLSEKIKIYPNPAKDYVYIETLNKVVLINILGERILETTDTLINVGNLERGIYLVKSGKTVKKLIIN